MNILGLISQLIGIKTLRLTMHLYKTLQQAIGLNSATLEGFGTLGTGVIIVELNSLRSEHD